MIIPAGTLDQHPGIEPTQNIFCASKADWYKPSSELPEHAELPIKSWAINKHDQEALLQMLINIASKKLTQAFCFFI